MTHYLVNIVKEGRFFVARYPTLDVTSQGKTLEEARCNIQEAIESYIEALLHSNNLIFDNLTLTKSA